MSFIISGLEDLVDRAFSVLDRYNWRPVKKIAGRVLFVLVAAAAMLYAVGLWDFTFIPRPEKKPHQAVVDNTPAPGGSSDGQNTPPAPDTPDTTPDTAVPDTTDGQEAPPPTPDEQQAVQIFHMSDLCSEGYYVTSRDYDPSSHRIAVMNLELGAPREYSVRERNVYAPSFEYEYAYGEAKVNYNLVAEARPSLEAYGGYLFADNGTDVIIFDSYGNYVSNFNEALFFAYTRDRYGNPLFWTPSTFRVYDENAEYYTDVETKSYYALTPGGIVASDHTEELYSRGVHADLPASYGAQTEPYNRSVIVNTASHMSLKGKLTGWRRTLWGFTAPGGEEPFTFGWYDPDEAAAQAGDGEGDSEGDGEGGEATEEPKLSAEERFALAKQKEEDWNNTPSHAYNFSEGYACVANEKGQMWFIDRNGETLFETKDIKGYNQVGRPVVDNLLLPLTNGIESLGFYYFDHGLVRVRRQSYDYLQVEDWDTLRPEYDDDELIYADGQKFTLAEGYDIISYSNGMILLEKNGRYGYMDYTGAWIIQPQLEGAKPYVEGLAPIKRDGRWGVTDTSGNTVIPFCYDSIQTTSSGMIVCHRNGGWTVFAKMAAMA